METRANYVLVGAVTLGAVLLGFLFALWIARASFAREYATYDIVFEGAARGIGAGTEVRFNGIQVGEVQRLFIDPTDENRVVARIRIGADWPVRVDSDARLEPIGLTGLNLIQISAGKTASPLRRQRLGEPPPRVPARQGALDELLYDSEDITQTVNEVLTGARDMLSKENAKRIERILVNLEKTSSLLADNRGLLNSTNEAAQQLRDAGRAFTATAVEIEQFARQGRSSLAALEGQAGGALRGVEQATVAIGDAARNVDAAANTAALTALPELASAASDLRRLSETLDRVASDVERSPTFAAVGGQKPLEKVDP